MSKIFNKLHYYVSEHPVISTIIIFIGLAASVYAFFSSGGIHQQFNNQNMTVNGNNYQGIFNTTISVPPDLIIKDFRMDVEYASKLNQETNETGWKDAGLAYRGDIVNSTEEIEIAKKESVILMSDYYPETVFPDKKTKVIKLRFTPTNDILINKRISFLERYDMIILPFNLSPLPQWDSPTVEVRVKILINGKLVYDAKDTALTSWRTDILYYRPKDLFSNIEQRYISIT